MPECLCQFLLIILFFKRLKGCKYVSLMNGLRITKFSCLCYSSLLCIPEIGLGLIGFGFLFSLLGIIMLFDKGFLAMGNILFVSGALLTIGPKPTVQFFTKPKKHKGSLSFGFGFFLILIGWPVLGMMLESYCFITLFSGFWPTAAAYLQKSPSVGWIFHHPLVTSLITLFRGRRVPV